MTGACAACLWLAACATSPDGDGDPPETAGIGVSTHATGATTSTTGETATDDADDIADDPTGADAPGTGGMDTTTGADSTGPGNGDDPGPVLSFAPDVYDAIIGPSCSCHVAGVAGGLPMPDAATAYENLVNGMGNSGLDLVLAGDASLSYLAAKVEGEHIEFGGDTGQMPLGGTLTSEQIATFSQWINTGALP